MINIGIGLAWKKRSINTTINSLINSFETRVLADEGTFEARACLTKTLVSLGGISYKGLVIFNFLQRVSIDGGAFEAESCLNTTLTNLNNI